MATLDGVWTGEGWSKRVLCPQCETTGEYSNTWDSAYCPVCLHWLEQACRCDEHSGCPYVGRPESPTLYC